VIFTPKVIIFVPFLLTLDFFFIFDECLKQINNFWVFLKKVSIADHISGQKMDNQSCYEYEQLNSFARLGKRAPDSSRRRKREAINSGAGADISYPNLVKRDSIVGISQWGRKKR
jgi:hypothetical protein